MPAVLVVALVGAAACVYVVRQPDYMVSGAVQRVCGRPSPQRRFWFWFWLWRRARNKPKPGEQQSRTGGIEHVVELLEGVAKCKFDLKRVLSSFSHHVCSLRQALGMPSTWPLPPLHSCDAQ